LVGASRVESDGGIVVRQPRLGGVGGRDGSGAEDEWRTNAARVGSNARGQLGEVVNRVKHFCEVSTSVNLVILMSLPTILVQILYSCKTIRIPCVLESIIIIFFSPTLGLYHIRLDTSAPQD
jgi:hypothetical protein